MTMNKEMQVSRDYFMETFEEIIAKVLDGCDTPEDRRRYYEEIITYTCGMGVPGLTYTKDIDAVYERHSKYIDYLWNEYRPAKLEHKIYEVEATFFAVEFEAGIILREIELEEMKKKGRRYQ